MNNTPENGTISIPSNDENPSENIGIVHINYDKLCIIIDAEFL